jgi:hypothetical protein
MPAGRLVLLLVLAAVTCDASEPIHVSAPHVRSTDRIVLMALARGAALSETFRRMVARLEASDVIVHVERREAGAHPFGFTQFIATTRHVRYLRITVAASDASDATVALLGHELRHALETADAPEVTDQDSYQAFYRRIGRASCAPPQWCFDTTAAVRTGAQVRAELRGRRRASARLPPAEHHQRQREN